MKNRTICLGLILLATGVTMQGCLPDIAAIAQDRQSAHLFERSDEAGPDAPGPLDRSSVDCEIRSGTGTTRTSLEALIIATDPSIGRFTLELERSGPSGSSRVTQAGEFDLAAGETEQIGRVMLGGGNGRVKADLSVRDDDGEILCETSYPNNRKPEQPKTNDLDEVFET